MPTPPKKPPSLGAIKEQEAKPTKPSKEINKFRGEGDFHKIQYSLERETFHLRWIACSAALIIVGLLVALECVIIKDIDFSSADPGYLIFISISPIIAVTAIVVSILFSVFRVKVDSVGDASKAAQIISSASSGL